MDNDNAVGHFNVLQETTWAFSLGPMETRRSGLQMWMLWHKEVCCLKTALHLSAAALQAGTDLRPRF